MSNTRRLTFEITLDGDNISVARSQTGEFSVIEMLGVIDVVKSDLLTRNVCPTATNTTEGKV